MRFYFARFRDYLACSLGFHDFVDYEEMINVGKYQVFRNAQMCFRPGCSARRLAPKKKEEKNVENQNV